MTRHRRYDTEAEAAAQPSRVDDLRIDSGQAWRTGRFVALLATLIAGGILATRDIEWWLVPFRAAYIGVITGAVVCVVLFVLFVRDERQERRQARPKPPQVEQSARAEPPPRTVPIIIKRGDGKQVHERYDGLPIPKQGPEALARYFWRVLREDRTLAFRNPYHIGRDEVQAIKDFFTNPENGLGEDLGGNLGVKPNDEGKDMMRQFVRRHYPDAHLP